MAGSAPERQVTTSQRALSDTAAHSSPHSSSSWFSAAALVAPSTYRGNAASELPLRAINHLR
jgi:hypothetical protein